MNHQLHKALSLGTSLVLIASPSFAQSIQSKATLYGYIVGEDGTLKAGSVGITTSAGKVGHPSTGHYCILPSSPTLKAALTDDVNNGTGYVNVQLTQSSTSWPVVGKYVTQITGANVTHGTGCASNEIAVSIMQHTGCAEPTGITDPSLATCTDGYASANSDFTVVFE